MKLKNIAVFVILLQFSCVVEGTLSWGIPAVEPPDKFIGNVSVWNYNEISKTLYMNIDEEILPPFDLILINCEESKNNESRPDFGLFEAGTSVSLGGKINKTENNYVLQITRLQDFEDKTQQQEYHFSLYLGSNMDDKIEVFLSIIDIDDTPPIILLKDRPCVIPENTPGPTNCTFTLFDPDSPLIDIKFPLPSANNVSQHFIMKLNTSSIVGQSAQTYLDIIEDLDFETLPMYYFEVLAIDPQNNKGSDQIIVKVEDMPDVDPEWITIITTETLKEHENKTYVVFARDGDLEIQAEIGYKFETTEADPCHENITVTKEGIISVINIDRDEPELKDNIIKCSIVAYELQDISAKTPRRILFIIEDINDNIPKIKILQKEINITEYEFTTIQDVFLVTDIDQGQNAQFDVSLKDLGNINFSKAFQIIPYSGYRNWSFSLSVIDAEKLDYDKEDWRTFELQIHSKDQGVYPNPQEDNATIIIQLINMNNKAPEFIGEPGDFIIKIFENVNKSAEIIQVVAKDEDTDDCVSFQLTIGEENFEIEKQVKSEWSAKIYTKMDKVFDYEKQKQVVIEVSATDSLQPGTIHTKSQKITIEVQDVNDESPKLILPNDTPEIDEHKEIGSLVFPSFEAIDVDTSAELQLTIKWEECYGVKEGRKITDIEKFQDVFIIVVTYLEDDEGNKKKGYANGTFKVNNNNTLDYEEYEILYLKIQAQDIKQEEGNGFDNSIMAVIIKDINDHAPEFTESTINSSKLVIESSESNTLIGTIQAIDRDGPGNNNVYYYLEPLKGTKDGLVKIDRDSGILRVDKSKEIDADCPNTYSLNYTVIASDSMLKLNRKLNETQISITIIDINDIYPSLLKNLTSLVRLKEGNYSMHYLQIIDGIDYDRDDPHNNISYYLNRQFDATIHEYFHVDEISGKIYANNEFLWSEERETIVVDLIIRDNFKSTGISFEYPTQFSLYVEDINNNEPILDQNIEMQASENDNQCKFIAKITATDKDKPCTPHTYINYRIVEIRNPNDEVLAEEILVLENKHEEPDKKCQYYANLYTNKDLINYYGTYSVCIIAENIGNESFYNEHCYDLVITPYNFKPPKVIFPKNNAIIVLKKDQNIGQRLLTADDTLLTNFVATDDQGGKYTMVFYEDTNWNDMFILHNLGGSKAQLQLRELPKDDDKKIFLTIKAQHNGIGSSETVVKTSFTVFFIDSSELPHFVETQQTIEIIEDDKDVCKSFNRAIDNKCIETANCSFSIYYYQMEEYEHEFFDVRQTEPILCIKNPLDREQYASHNLTIVSTNTEDSPPRIIPKNHLKITIEVADINNHAPKFDKDLYTAGVTTKTKLHDKLINLTATDVDIVDEGKLRYIIVESSTTAIGSEIDTIQIPFKIENIQQIVNNFKPLKEMSGYFVFTVKVFDSDDLHSDEAQVKIHIISETNQIELNFKNKYKEVKDQIEMIELIFSQETGYNCTIDEFTQKEEKAEDVTIVTAHFIDEKNEAVDKKVVLDIIYNNNDMLQVKFKILKLNFVYLKSDEPEIISNEELLQTLLIVVSVILGTLIIVLIIAFVLRTRSLNLRIASMTTNVFGSTKSDLNRIGTNAPGTNRHAIEANPVWNEEINDINNFDAISQASGGSDLIGIEDNAEFQYTRRDSVNRAFEPKNNGITFDDDYDDDIASLPGSSSNQFKFS